MTEEIIEWNEKTDLLSSEVECPQCGDKYMHGSPYIVVPCNKCGITYKTDFKQDIYIKKAMRLIERLSFNNKIKLRASEKYDSAICKVQYHFKNQYCYDVSEITRTKEEYRRCKECGICYNCFTCTDCQTNFQRDKNRRKQRCPECKSTKFKKTYFKNPTQTENKNRRLCPNCKSDKIALTRTRNKTKCHLCSSKNLTETKINIIYELSIERKKAYRTENYGR